MTTLNEEYVSRGRMVAVLLWVWVVVMLGTGWMVALLVPARLELACMFAATACASSALAATYHLRTYIVRLCGVVRSMSGHTVRPVIHSVDD